MRAEPFCPDSLLTITDISRRVHAIRLDSDVSSDHTPLVFTVANGHVTHQDLEPHLTSVTDLSATDWSLYYSAVSSQISTLPQLPTTSAHTEIMACTITNTIKTAMAMVTPTHEVRAI